MATRGAIAPGAGSSGAAPPSDRPTPCGITCTPCRARSVSARGTGRLSLTVSAIHVDEPEIVAFVGQGRDLGSPGDPESEPVRSGSVTHNRTRHIRTRRTRRTPTSGLRTSLPG